jgi:hypothetical protein
LLKRSQAQARQHQAYGIIGIGDPLLFAERDRIHHSRKGMVFQWFGQRGADNVLRQANESYEQGDYRWVAEVVNHVVFADANNVAAKQLLADTYEQLGYQSESARILSSNGVQEYGVIDLAVS